MDVAKAWQAAVCHLFLRNNVREMLENTDYNTSSPEVFCVLKMSVPSSLLSGR